jgi:AcrR family transcriptional regulator
MIAQSVTPSRGRRRGPADSETATRILDAAEELFATNGYDGVSVRDITEKVGVNKALLFYYFESKGDLFEKVVERFYGAHIQAFVSAFGESGTLHERAHRVLDAYTDFMENNPRFPLLLQRELANPNSHPYFRRGVEMIATWFDRAFADVGPVRGYLSSQNFFLTFAGMVGSFYVHAPIMEEVCGQNPTTATARRERREHLHWILETFLDRLLAEAAAERQ